MLDKHLTHEWVGVVENSFSGQLRSNVYGIRFRDRNNLYTRYEANLRKAPRPRAPPNTCQTPCRQRKNDKKIHDASLMTAVKPLQIRGEIDLDCYDALVTEQMRNGVEGLIVCGTTGEGHLMDWENT